MQQDNCVEDTAAVAGEIAEEADSRSAAPGGELSLEVGLASDVGPRRKLNEDCADYHLPEDSKLQEAKGTVFVVADGMGGHQAGDVASRQAVGLVIDAYYADDAPKPGDSLVRAIKAANRSLHEEALSDPAKNGMGTTLVAAIVQGNKVYVANVGDSRAYVIDEQGITQITEDHSWVEEQVRAGLLTHEQAATHPQRNLITRALGSRPSVNVDLFEGEMHEGQALLLCTDGLSNPLSDQHMAQIILAMPPAEAVQELVRQAAERGGDDNATALVVQAGAPPSERIQDKVETVVTSRPSNEVTPAISQSGQPQSQIKPSPGARSWRTPIIVIGAVLILVLGATLAWLAGPGALRGGQSDLAPQVAPLVDHRLAGQNLEQAAAYLGYAGPAEMRAAHGDQLDAADLESMPLWPSQRWLLLAGSAQADRCANRVCSLRVEAGDSTYWVTYQPVPDDEPRAGSHHVRIFGLVQGDCPGETGCTQVGANRIEREGSSLAWNRGWEEIFQAAEADSQVWVYGIVATGAAGLIDPDEKTGLDAGTQILARGQWLTGEQPVEFAADEVYVLEGGQYVPRSSQMSPSLLPTVTLEPTQTTNP